MKKQINSNYIIAIDAINVQRGGGVTYLVELLNNIIIEHHNFSKIYIWGSKSTLAKLKNTDWLFKKNHFLLNNNLFFRTIWQLFFLRKNLNKYSCQILYVPGSLFVTNFRPVVTLSQNMLPFQSQEMFRFGISIMTLKLVCLKILQANSFKQTNGLIFLTNFAKQTISTNINLRNKNTIVIPHGISKHFFVSSNNRITKLVYDFDNPMNIIYVSIIDEYKHQINVLKAVSSLRSQGYQINIKFVGPAYKPTLNRFIKYKNSVDPDHAFSEYVGTVNYDELPKHIFSSDVFLFASSCENLPNILLEGMASSIPILCSNMGPMPEILGDSGIYFDPLFPNSIAEAIKKAYLTPDLFRHLSNSTFEKANTYSWDKCTRDTFNFIESTYLNYKK